MACEPQTRACLLVPGHPITPRLSYVGFGGQNSCFQLHRVQGQPVLHERKKKQGLGKGREWEGRKEKKGRGRGGKEGRTEGEQRRGREDDGLSCGRREFKVKAKTLLGV